MVITLTTDFGTGDAYVAAMKGVILGINPQAILVDICHEIEPQNVLQAAFILHTVYKYFPKGTIHLVVVDPGVGTGRKAILLLARDYYFITPDNGVLSYILAENAQTQALHLNNPHFWLPAPSSTFHGRDIFAPVAAHLSLGVPPHQMGEPVSSLITFPIPQPSIQLGVLRGQVLHIDHFGNIITNIKSQQLPQGRAQVEIAGYTIEGLSQTYAQGGNILALIGSSGYLEIAARNENAARLLSVKVGQEVKVKPASDSRKS